MQVKSSKRLLVLALLLAFCAGCQTADEPVISSTADSNPTENSQLDSVSDDTQPAKTTDSQANESVDIRPLPSSDPGSALCSYDPSRWIYFGCENIYYDYYKDVSSLPSFTFFIYSRECLNADDIKITFPVDLPFWQAVSYVDTVQRKTEAMVSANEVIYQSRYLPYYVYQAYRGMEFSSDEDKALYSDFELLMETDLPEFYVYAVGIAFVNIEELKEPVVLEKLDITVGDHTYEAKLGRVRLFPAEAFPAEASVEDRSGAYGSYYQLYNDGLVYLPSVYQEEELEEDITLTGLRMAEEETQILDILVEMNVDGQWLEMHWDGITPIYLYKGDSINIDVVAKNEFTERLLNLVYFHTIVEYTDEMNQKACAVSTKAGGEGRNFHEYYAIIFDGVDMESYYREYYYKQPTTSWRTNYLNGE